MPSVSTAERRLMGLALHHPGQVSAKNRGVLRMSRQQLHDFASTPERGIPHYAPKKKRRRLADHLSRLRGAGHFRNQ